MTIQPEPTRGERSRAVLTLLGGAAALLLAVVIVTVAVLTESPSGTARLASVVTATVIGVTWGAYILHTSTNRRITEKTLRDELAMSRKGLLWMLLLSAGVSAGALTVAGAAVFSLLAGVLYGTVLAALVMLRRGARRSGMLDRMILVKRHQRGDLAATRQLAVLREQLRQEPL